MTVNQFPTTRVRWEGLAARCRWIKEKKKWNIDCRQKFTPSTLDAVVSLSHIPITGRGAFLHLRSTSSGGCVPGRHTTGGDGDASLVLTPGEGGQWRLIKCDSTWVN